MKKLDHDHIAEKLHDNFETADILDAVDILDEKLRVHLKNGSHGEPPTIRDDLLNLHTIVSSIAAGNSVEIKAMLELVDDIEYAMNEIIEAAESIRNTLIELTDVVDNDCYEGEDK